MTDDILFDRENTLAQITLNRPKALNALTLDMIDAMGERLTAWETDPSISCVLIRPAAGGTSLRCWWRYRAGLSRARQSLHRRVLLE